ARPPAALDSVTHAPERREQPRLRAAGEPRVGKAPSKLHAGSGRDGTVGVADGNDDVPPIANVVDGLASLLADVDADLAHRLQRERVQLGRGRAGAFDNEAVACERAEESLGHLRPGG